MKAIQTTSHSRRSFLRTSGAILALPFLETFASVKTITPKRLIFLGGGYGMTKESFYPQTAGSFKKIGLTKGLSPLKNHLENITLVSNLQNPQMRDPHSGTAGYLGGDKFKITCDQVAAKQIGQGSRYPSLVLSALGDQRDGHGSGGISLSCNDAGNPISGIKRPIDLYHTLFSGSDQTAEELTHMLAKKRSILDILASDGKSMSRNLAKNDQEKIDEYFTTLREVEKNLQRQAEWSNISKPKAPFNEPDLSLYGEDEIRVMLDLVIIALQTDSTRIATYRLPVTNLLKSLEIGINSHALSHYRASKSKRADSEKRDQKLMELFGYFITRLKETKDRDGNSLYDTTIVSFGSNLRSGHTLKSCPALLSGGGQTRLKHGSHIMLQEMTNLSNYWLTLLQEAGAPITQFSDSNGTISELFG